MVIFDIYLLHFQVILKFRIDKMKSESRRNKRINGRSETCVLGRKGREGLRMKSLEGVRKA